jgi:hypothetical protein
MGVCRALVMQEQPSEALPHCETAVRMDPSFVKRASPGQLYQQLGRAEDAREMAVFRKLDEGRRGAVLSWRENGRACTMTKDLYSACLSALPTSILSKTGLTQAGTAFQDARSGACETAPTALANHRPILKITALPFPEALSQVRRRSANFTGSSKEAASPMELSGMLEPARTVHYFDRRRREAIQ